MNLSWKTAEENTPSESRMLHSVKPENTAKLGDYLYNLFSMMLSESLLVRCMEEGQ